jgi:recombination associated protein RdgC
MPLLKNLIAYRVGAGWSAPSLRALEEALQAAAFHPCGPTEALSEGWVPPRGEEHGAMAEAVDGHWILRLAVERRVVPPSTIRGELEARCKAIEAEQGRKPGRKEKRDLKDEIVQTLMPRAFAKRTLHWLWLHPAEHLLVVGAASTRGAEVMLQALGDLMADMRHVIPLAPLHTAMSPAAGMAQWLSEQDPPPGFAVERDLELKDPGEDRSVVRYARHHLALDEIAQHIQEGKLPTRLAMNWEDRISFVLTDTLALKRLAMADVEKTPAGEDGFDADVAITTGELASLLSGLIEALGGEAPPSMTGAAVAAELTTMEN